MHQTSPAELFIAYAAKDRLWAERLNAALREAGIHTWMDADLRPGEPWKEITEQALRDCDTMVIILTVDSVSSPWAMFELGAAVAGNKRIIPLLPEPLDRSAMPPLIGRYRFLEETSPVEAARRLAEVIAEPA